jgi:NitT/TauT family transport system substrate-binding protein
MINTIRCAVLLGFAAIAVSATHAQANEKLTLGALKFSSNVPQYLAADRGYFADEGLDMNYVYFDAGQPVAVATLSGDVDIGAAGVTSALYQMAAQGGLRLIGGSSNTAPGFHTSAVLASNDAYAGGFKSFKDMTGRSVGLTQIGSTYHYAYALIAEKYGADLKSIRTLPLQSMGNVAAALVGGQADAGVLNTSVADPLVAAGKVKLIGWTDEEMPMQIAAIWTSAKFAKDRPETIQRFLRAWRRGCADYVAAFLGKDGKPMEGPGAAAILELLSRHMGQPVDQVRLALGFYDPDARLNVVDVQRQLDWYFAQGMLKTKTNVENVIDRRFVQEVAAR